MNELHDRTAWFKGGSSLCTNPLAHPSEPCRLILLGAPGVGKGTQAELLCARLGACHLSTGDVFRAAKKLAAGESNPELEKALGFMRRGELVPDETVLDLVRQRTRCLRCSVGFVLDGFPRTTAQAEALQNLLQAEGVSLTGVIHYELALDQVIARLSGRRTCLNCHSVYHLTTHPPQSEELCDHCGERLCQREDDKPETIRTRMKCYEETVAPLLEFYRDQGLLLYVPTATPEETLQYTLTALVNLPTSRISSVA